MVKIKQILTTILILGILGLPALVLLTGASSLPTFWNYEQHIAPQEEAGMRKDVGFNAYGDLNSLETAVLGNKVISAISSDYQAADFAKKGIIQKIDFEELWGLNYKYIPGSNTKELPKKQQQENLGKLLENIYTPLVFEILDKGYDLGENHLWEYVVPYFVQQKVIAFDIEKKPNGWKPEEKKALEDPIKFKQLFKDKSYKGILNTLRDFGYHRLIVNDYLRDNMMIGSEISSGGFSSKPNINDYKEHIDNFKKTIEDSDGFNQKVRSNNVNFDTDGTTVLENLVDPSKNWDTAILYNGDALDAYSNANENFPSKNNKAVRVVVPDNPIYLIDLLIMPSYIKKDDGNNLWTKAYQAMKNYLFKNGTVASLDGIDLCEPDSDYPLLINFNYIVYSMPYRIYDQAIKERYFKDEQGHDDLIALDIYNIQVPPKVTDIRDHITQNVSDTLFTSMFYYYMMMKN